MTTEHATMTGRHKHGELGRAARRVGANDARTARQTAEFVGRLAEWIAVARLRLAGYRILARRWRAPSGEIDIVAVHGRRLAFVEVKYRSRSGEAAHCIGRRQMARLHAAAAAFVARYPGFADHDRGFDAIFVESRLWPAYARDHLQPTIAAS
jgi:putative endonuclease